VRNWLPLLLTAVMAVGAVGAVGAVVTVRVAALRTIARLDGC
jgi:hypothetical protein